MGAFEYIALDNAGKERKGVLEAYEDFVMNYVLTEKIQNELRHYLFWD